MQHHYSRLKSKKSLLTVLEGENVTLEVPKNDRAKRVD